MKLQQFFHNCNNILIVLYRLLFQILILKKIFKFCFLLTLRNHSSLYQKQQQQQIHIYENTTGKTYTNRIYLLIIEYILTESVHLPNTIPGDRDATFVKFIFIGGATVKEKQQRNKPKNSYKPFFSNKFCFSSP